MLDDPRYHPPHHIDQNVKADPGAGPGGTVIGHVDPDQFPFGIQDGSSGISQVDGHVGLDASPDGPSTNALDIVAKGRDNSGGEGVVQSKGVANGKDGLTPLEC